MVKQNEQLEIVAYLLFTKVVGKVGNHDLCLAGDTILRRSALLARWASRSIGRLGVVGGSSQRSSSGITFSGNFLSVGLLAVATTTAGTTTTATATATSGLTATGTTLFALGVLVVHGGRRSRRGRLRLSRKLDGNLAVENSLAVEVVDGTLGLGRSGHVNKGVSNRAGGARVGGDGGCLTV
jgi:hypothetical protein